MKPVLRSIAGVGQKDYKLMIPWDIRLSQEDKVYLRQYYPTRYRMWRRRVRSCFHFAKMHNAEMGRCSTAWMAPDGLAVEWIAYINKKFSGPPSGTPGYEDN